MPELSRGRTLKSFWGFLRRGDLPCKQVVMGLTPIISTIVNPHRAAYRKSGGLTTGPPILEKYVERNPRSSKIFVERLS